jgi:hypothetical protein
MEYDRFNNVKARRIVGLSFFLCGQMGKTKESGSLLEQVHLREL